MDTGGKPITVKLPLVLICKRTEEDRKKDAPDAAYIVTVRLGDILRSFWLTQDHKNVLTKDKNGDVILTVLSEWVVDVPKKSNNKTNDSTVAMAKSSDKGVVL